MRSSINGVSADDVVRRALSDGLFGTEMLGRDVGWLARPIDPLAPLRGLWLDDKVLRPVSRLLFTQRLMTEQAASRIDSFALGPSHQGGRHLRATRTPPQVYVNAPDPTPVSIDGTVVGL
jgi:hypothetical protein